jgi:hypothetical protein
MGSTSVIANIALVQGDCAMKGRFKTARVRDGAVAFEVRAAASRLMRKASSDPARTGDEVPGEA